jgi:hypothetical protein
MATSKLIVLIFIMKDQRKTYFNTKVKNSLMATWEGLDEELKNDEEDALALIATSSIPDSYILIVTMAMRFS